MSNEISGNSGYLAMKIEATEGTAVTPTVYVPFYEESITTEANMETEMSVFGSKFARLQVTPGIRSHGGDITMMAEPNSTAMIQDILLTRGSVTGSDPYTWPFTPSFTNPKSATWDISNGRFVSRFVGVQASEFGFEVKDNELRWKVKVSALKSFLGARIASVSSSTLTLDTTYNSSPTDGLVASDLVAVWVAAGTTQNFTVSSFTATTVTLSGTPSGVAAGDMLMLRPATPSHNLAAPFLKSRSEFRIGATAAAALNGTAAPMDDGSEFTIVHPFQDDKGAQRWGSADPGALIRAGSVDATLKLKKFFYHPDEIRRFQNLEKIAVVVRCFSGTGTHEFRLTLNNCKIVKGGDKPMIKTDEAEYYEMELVPTYDTSDSAGLSTTVINGLAAA